MRKDFYYPSHGAGQIHAIRWEPEQEPIAVVQIVHGIADYAERYSHFASYLNSKGFLVVAEDHMGHGSSIDGGSQKGYFHGGWFAAIEDTFQLLQDTRKANPTIPYILFGHSMGSFMARTILCKYPDSGIAAAIICGTCWQPRQLLPMVIGICSAVCKAKGERTPVKALHDIVFGSYNKKIKNPVTAYDWISTDPAQVQAYASDPLCGFVPACGLLREMMRGLLYTEQPENLAKMNLEIPVLFIGGGDDPVGLYGKSIPQAADAFRNAGVTDVAFKIYPHRRHEILNEVNREEVYSDCFNWITSKLFL